MRREYAIAALLLTACRFGFDRAESLVADAGSLDTPADAPPPIAFVAHFAQQHPAGGTSDVFTAQGSAVGNVVVMQVSAFSCGGTPTLSVTAPGWTFNPLDTPSGPTYSSQLFAAFVPNTAPVTVTVTVSGGACFLGAELADEFTAVDPTGGTTTFVTAQASGTGDAIGSITSAHANATVWAACFSSAAAQVPVGWTPGADNSGGDLSAYRLTSDPAGTVHSVSFPNSGNSFRLSMVSLKPL